MKQPKKVDVNRGLNCNRDMATSHLDQLAEEINHADFGELTYVEPRVWTGAADLSRQVHSCTTRSFQMKFDQIGFVVDSNIRNE